MATKVTPDCIRFAMKLTLRSKRSSLTITNVDGCNTSPNKTFYPSSNRGVHRKKNVCVSLHTYCVNSVFDASPSIRRCPTRANRRAAWSVEMSSGTRQLRLGSRLMIVTSLSSFPLVPVSEIDLSSDLLGLALQGRWGYGSWVPFWA